MATLTVSACFIGGPSGSANSTWHIANFQKVSYILHDRLLPSETAGNT